jgi:hydrogenase maturation protease
MERSWTRSCANDRGRPASLLVVGYGNTLRRDDGAGVVAAAQLADTLGRSLLDDQRVRIITCHQLLPDLCEDLAACDRAIFIDAAIDLTPGVIRRESLEHDDSAAAGAGLHMMSPRGLLGMAAALYGRAPQAQLWSIGVADLSIGEGLSSRVQQAVAQVVASIAADTRTALADAPGREISHA